MKNKLFGLIYLSSYKIQLYIVNLRDMTKVEQVISPSLVQSNDKFATYEGSLFKIADFLNGFKEKLAEYQIINYKVFGNRQLLGQLNARYFQEQIFVRTGLKIIWLNASQVAYYKVISGINSFPALEDEAQGDITYLLSLGSSMMNLSLFNGAHFVSTLNIALGPEELDDIKELTQEATINPIKITNDYITSKLGHVRKQFSYSSNATFIIQHSAFLNQTLLKGHASEITFAEFEKTYHEVINTPEQQLRTKFDLDENSFALATPQFITIKELLKLAQAKRIYVIDHSVITGLLIEEAVKQKLKKAEFNSIIITSAQNMAKRYLVDTAHMTQVTKFALHLFDRLKKIHLLSKTDRKLLKIACTINDIGNFIDPHHYHQHSSYILEVNQIIGLSDRENEIIAEIARYQNIRGSQQDERHYRHLDPQIQMTVAKLAGIARLASSLDFSRRQKISKIMVSTKNKDLEITASSNQDLTLERWALKKQAKLFEEVFGIKVVLKQKRKG